MHPKFAGLGRRCSIALAAVALPGALALAPGAASAAGTSTAGGAVAPVSATTVTSPAPATQGDAVSGGLTISKASTPKTAGTGRTTAGAGGISGGAIAAAVLGGLVLLACIVWAIFRFGALEPPWLLSARHSFAEAGFRASATWAEFGDWLRLGR